MFLKFLSISGLMLAAQVSAHAAINPVLGVKAAKAVRNDVQRPNNNTPCGKTDIAQNIDSSTAVTADSSGSFGVSVENFNGGKDGSRQVTMTVDPSGKGDSFVDGTVSKNGEAAPADTGTEQITASLPAGVTCTGGAAGNKCLASFVTAGGFGNCVVVQQLGQGGKGGDAGGAASGSAATGDAAANDQAKGSGADKAKDDDKEKARQASGTRRARAMLPGGARS